jgi:hypothetical protein
MRRRVGPKLESRLRREEARAGKQDVVHARLARHPLRVQDLDADGGQAVAGRHALEGGLQLVDLNSASLVLVTPLRFSARHRARVVVRQHGRAQLVARVGREARGVEVRVDLGEEDPQARVVRPPVRLACDGEQLHVLALAELQRAALRAREEG